MPTPPFVDPWLPLPDENGNVPTARAATPIAVYKIVAGSTYTYTALQNVRCMAIEEHDGPAPATAVFRYAFDGRSSGPQTIEQALSTAFGGDGVVVEGDRLGVYATHPDGTGVWIFDGFALTWHAVLHDGTESAQIHAVSVAKRCWDEPIGGALIRTPSTPQTGGADVATDIVAQFNPRGVANCSPSTGDSGTTPTNYPVFLDPDTTGTDTASIAYPRTWTLNRAAAHLLFGPWTASLQTYVQLPTRSYLDELLVSQIPIGGGTPYDPTDSSTFTTSPISVSDVPISGRALPTVLHDLVRDLGFGFTFKLTTASGNPITTLNLWRRQTQPAKPLLLQAEGSLFDPQWTNTSGASLGRDLSVVVNRWVVRGGLDRYEASFVLSAGFPMASTDATPANLPIYDNTAAGFATSAAFNAYRLWQFCEDGVGYYPNGTATISTGFPPSLDAILGAPTSGVARYVKRRRPPIGQLLTVDAQGRPIHYRLAISKDYVGSGGPAIWDGTGHWQHVIGGYELLKDRIGIRLTCQHPNKWNIGAATDTFPTLLSPAPFADGKVNAVDLMSGSASPYFFLLLTVVIEADQGLYALADVSPMTPIPWPVTREVDARDRYRRTFVYGKSEFNSTSTNVTMHDDTVLATAEATALRINSEAGVMEGNVEIPRFTDYYQIGDRISQIQGRNLGLRTDNGGTGSGPVYPVVVSRRWEFEGAQTTHLTLSDSGVSRRRFASKHGGSGHHVAERAAKPLRPTKAVK